MVGFLVAELEVGVLTAWNLTWKMESFELECGGRCQESFKMNEFYETIQVPKFHDFIAIEEEPMIDPRAWFNDTNPGTSLNLGLSTHLHICPFVHIFPYDGIFFQGNPM